MASKRHERRVSCAGKVRYPSLDVASRSACALSRKYGEALHAYRCSFGEHYHVGHVPARRACT